jgi:DNA-binding CsgD family transcriptional regulator/PAS domain-containing protein
MHRSPGKVVSRVDHEAIARDFYDDVLNPDGFDKGSLSLARALSAQQMTFLVWDKPSNFVRPAGAARQIRELTDEYVAHYQDLDPAKPGISTVAVGQWWIDSQRLGTDGIKSSCFHQEFLRRYALSSFMSSPIIRDERREVVVSCLRGLDVGVFSEADSQSVAQLLPHLQRAFSLHERYERLSRIARLNSVLLEHLPFGLAVVDARFRVLAHNERGEQLLGFFGSSDQWTVRRFKLPYALSEMISSACRTRDPLPAQAYQLAVHGHPLGQLVIMRLDPSHRLLAGFEVPAALILFYESQAVPKVLGTLLRDLFGLTPAEIRLAKCMLDGGNLSEWIERLRISRATARSHLQAIYRKTGVNTQAQLVRIVSILASVTQPDRK